VKDRWRDQGTELEGLSPGEGVAGAGEEIPTSRGRIATVEPSTRGSGDWTRPGVILAEGLRVVFASQVGQTKRKILCGALRGGRCGEPIKEFLKGG